MPRPVRARADPSGRRRNAAGEGEAARRRIRPKAWDKPAQGKSASSADAALGFVRKMTKPCKGGHTLSRPLGALSVAGWTTQGGARARVKWLAAITRPACLPWAGLCRAFGPRCSVRHPRRWRPRTAGCGGTRVARRLRAVPSGCLRQAISLRSIPRAFRCGLEGLLACSRRKRARSDALQRSMPKAPEGWRTSGVAPRMQADRVTVRCDGGEGARATGCPCGGRGVSPHQKQGDSPSAEG